MTTFTIDLWLLVVGAIAGAGAAIGATGRGRVLKGGVIGAALAVLAGVVRGYL
ncbi:hypothetical protein [Roseovarius salinarum]|uniref:hypothetical protein n=1 Tax=Roseovarius salinarum TaxID=1981892 RepID=UPI0013001108|nr:hypothetical protein [Roseovarius salinarum]